MWGMQYTHSGNMITLRSDASTVRFRVIGESSSEAQKSFDSFVLTRRLQPPPPENPQAPLSCTISHLSPQDQFCKLFERFSSGKGGQPRRHKKTGGGRLSLPEVGRLLRTFLGPLTHQQVSAIVTSVTGSVGMHVSFSDFVSICCAHLPIVPCLDYLTPYLESDQNATGFITGQAAAQLLERCGFLEAARRLRQESPEFVTYPHFLHLTVARHHANRQ